MPTNIQENTITENGFLAGTADIALWVVLVGILLVYVVVSIILEHHWKNYGITRNQIKKLRYIYFGVSGVLIITMIASFVIWKL